MKVLKKEDLPLNEETVCTIGNFDGFHKGHAYILHRVKETAEQERKKSVVITFEPHPKKILFPEKAPCRITGLETKIDLLGTKGIDYLYIVHFDKKFAEKSPEEFIKFLSNQLKCKKLIVGHDWKFGYRGEGDIQKARELGEKYNLLVEVIPPIKSNNERISSTKIRKLLKEGKVEEVANLLGRMYCIKGKIEKGHQLGKKIGFPTINIKPPEDLCLKKGVYSGYVSFNGKMYPAVINYGNRPTVDGKELFIEAHIIDRKIDISEKEEVKIFFKRFIRDEKKFDSIEQLKKQIQSDIKNARKALEVR
ncbi:riboflavin kinase / FMN adenylyltransferase [Persephonella hydrogeniphila]|uniref:Riboflavin biosynthesis protein n=1 Tax=Persephonella hydrogeniphila TaxID=198703 RepID=A0A285NA41_9AQUI|nr:bifunctional riboflavin kinase/FAD synthetase [Persephonella hydrogeniphila]SNZ06342.1 riboflavin kinase / FMN adenylyltransferase [Persephonella hydrogeniphila]